MWFTLYNFKQSINNHDLELNSFSLSLKGMVGDGVKCTRTDPCESSPCFPGSVCLPLHEKGSYECGPCPDGLIGTGKVCRPPFHPCESNPCYPGVACGEKDDSFECGSCPAGTIGDGIMCKGKICDVTIFQLRYNS